MRNSLKVTVAVAACAASLIALAPIARADVTYYTPPKFKHKVLPVYPDVARAKHETGTVILKVLVAANGTPKQFVLFKSSGHKDLDDAVMTAAKASTYTPAMRGSTPQLAFYDVTYKFNLTGVAQDEGNQSALSKKLEANPRDVSTRISLGTNYLNQRNYAQAEALFKTGTQLVPNNAKLWAYLGLAYYQDADASKDVSKYKPSVDAYDQALKLDPKVETSNIAAASYFNYGFHLQQSGDNAGALAYAQKAVNLAPKAAQYYILLGEAQTATGDYVNAVATLKKAEALDDKKGQNWQLVTARIVADEANAELAQNDKVNGFADINRSEQIAPHAPFAYEYLFSYYVKSGNRAAALTPLMQLAQIQPTEVIWQVQIGNIYLNQNNIAAAHQAFQKALDLKPDSPDAQYGMAELAAATGDTATLKPLMAKIIAAEPAKQAADMQAGVAVYLLNASQGKTTFASDAQTYADAATKGDPGNGEAWYALGVADLQLKNRDGANLALKKAYDIFKSQNNTEMMKTISDAFKQANGSDITGYTYGKSEQTNQPGH